MDLSDFQAQSQVEYRLNLRSFYFLSLKLASNTAEAAFWNKDQAIIFQTVLDQQSELFTMFALWRGLRCLQWQLQVWLEKTAVHFNKSSCILISNLPVSVLIVQSDKTNGGTDKGRDIHLKRAFK